MMPHEPPLTPAPLPVGGAKPTTKQALLAALCAAPDCFCSGQALAQSLGVSRAAVHKAALALQKQGFCIEAVTRRGYRLRGGADVLCAAALGGYPHPCHFFESTESTNLAAKQLAAQGAPHGTLVIGGEQTNGRGRRGRSFESPAGHGLYLSLVLRPNLCAEDALRITTSAAVAVANVVQRRFGIALAIKWVNDLYYNSKKVCGILTESSCNIDTGELEFVVIGIGLNLTTPPEAFGTALAQTATSLFPNSACPVPRAALGGEIASEILALCPAFDTLEAYRARCITPNHWVTVSTMHESYPAKAIELDAHCRLVVERDNGRREVLSFGDVSVKPARFD